MCRGTEEEVGLTVGLPRHGYFVGFFNVPVQAPTRGHPFYSYSEMSIYTCTCNCKYDKCYIIYILSVKENVLAYVKSLPVILHLLTCFSRCESGDGNQC